MGGSQAQRHASSSSSSSSSSLTIAMSGPVPSSLVLLSDLTKCPPGTKARFLGCIDGYIVATATLRLKHNYPPSNLPVIANVNIEHVLGRIKPHEMDVGTWINVIGYVERPKGKEKAVFVQAIAVWDAGNVDLEQYQKAVERRNETA